MLVSVYNHALTFYLNFKHLNVHLSLGQDLLFAYIFDDYTSLGFIFLM